MRMPYLPDMRALGEIAELPTDKFPPGTKLMLTIGRGERGAVTIKASPNPETGNIVAVSPDTEEDDLGVIARVAPNLPEPSGKGDEMSDIAEIMARAIWDARHGTFKDTAIAAIAALDAAGFAIVPKDVPPPPDVIGVLEFYACKCRPGICGQGPRSRACGDRARAVIEKHKGKA
jgi:hypothetical protein